MSEGRRIRCVGAILVNPHGQILLQQRDDKPGLLYANHWTTFGGSIEDGETPDEAIQRELLEEIELAPQLRLWKVFDNPVQRVTGEWVTVEQYIYIGLIDRLMTEITVNEGQAVGYFGVEDLEGLPIAFGFETLFRELFAHKEELL